MHVLKRVPTVHPIEPSRIHLVGRIAPDHFEAPRLCDGSRFIRDLNAGAIPASRTSQDESVPDSASHIEQRPACRRRQIASDRLNAGSVVGGRVHA